jgi:hypothetical protein
MKTKILSKLMLVCFTAFMVVNLKSYAQIEKNYKDGKTNARNNNTSSNAIAPICDVCSPKDSHVIEIDKALRLIADFHNVVITRNSKIHNAGGYFTEVVPAGMVQQNSLLNFRTFKIHWAVENIENNLTRLFIMVDPSNRNCLESGSYDGTSGLESTQMMATYHQNDIPIFTSRGNELSTTKILFELKEKMRNIDPSLNHFRNIRNVSQSPQSPTEAQNLLNAFKNDPDVEQFYNCDDLVFEKAFSLDQISRFPDGQKSFFYFFGYDREMTNHPLRLILAGYDAQNKIVFYDGTGISLLRQNSRPRP